MHICHNLLGPIRPNRLRFGLKFSTPRSRFHRFPSAAVCSFSCSSSKSGTSRSCSRGPNSEQPAADGVQLFIEAKTYPLTKSSRKHLRLRNRCYDRPRQNTRHPRRGTKHAPPLQPSVVLVSCFPTYHDTELRICRDIEIPRHRDTEIQITYTAIPRCRHTEVPGYRDTDVPSDRFREIPR